MHTNRPEGYTPVYLQKVQGNVHFTQLLKCSKPFQNPQTTTQKPQTGPDHFYYTLKAERQRTSSYVVNRLGGRRTKLQRTKLGGRPSRRVRVWGVTAREKEKQVKLQWKKFKVKRYKSGKCKKY
jgi:hypothetical protein